MPRKDGHGRRLPARSAPEEHPHIGSQPSRDSSSPRDMPRGDELEELQRQHPDDFQSAK